VAVVVGILLIDLAGFILWALSGQTPIDGFYIGAITNWTINLI
jgi:hypothetical protein